MNRRKLLTAAGVAVTSTAVAAPAIAQSMPVLRWRLATSGLRGHLRQLLDQADSHRTDA
jgi:TRAP-type mannitol/chloroaromatic compound transport system substrate-binding protein